MSEPIRYTQNIKCVEPSYHAQNIQSGMVECSIGEWVLHSDYARLKAEVERLNAVIESHKDAGIRIFAMMDEERRNTSHLKAEVERLTNENGNNSFMKEEWYLKCMSARAENERLRKAGDWMREALEEGPIDYQCRIDRWNAVKEAKHTK